MSSVSSLPAAVFCVSTMSTVSALPSLSAMPFERATSDDRAGEHWAVLTAEGRAELQV